MGYWGALALVALLSLLLAVLACWFLARGSWLWAWLRGNFGLAILALAMLAGLLGYDLSRYSTQQPGQPLATLSFNQLDEQRYQVRLAETGKAPRELVLEGDLWQLELRSLHWRRDLRAFGFQPTGRLYQLRSRYYLLEQEQLADQADIPLNPSLWSVDLWQLLQRLPGQELLRAELQQTLALPMSDGALYAVRLGPGQRLEVEPLNSVAQAKVQP